MTSTELRAKLLVDTLSCPEGICCCSSARRVDLLRTHDEEVSVSVAAKEGYCVKCKAKREIKDAQAITMKNGRPATQGLCPECGTKIFKIGAN